ncbi:MAG: hypothetical protein JJE30_06525 [Desulfuromonadales bacterium]|nr:hypothetical protein [Desulfuromonadales bacterium]
MKIILTTLIAALAAVALAGSVFANETITSASTAGAPAPAGGAPASAGVFTVPPAGNAPASAGGAPAGAGLYTPSPAVSPPTAGGAQSTEGGFFPVSACGPTENVCSDSAPVGGVPDTGTIVTAPLGSN